jgi:hypothetical protein
MAAATQDRDTPRHGGAEFGLPVKAGAKLFAGTIGCVDATGFAIKGSTSTTLKAVGIVQAQVDNTIGQNGDVTVTVRRGCFRLANSASTDQITNADIGAQAYIVDDQTVAKTSGSSTRSVAGVVRLVDAYGVWVEF